MKILSISLTVALFSLFLSCDNDSAIREKAAQTLPQPSPQTNTNQMPVSGALAGVQHYICPNNCQGSGGAAEGNCPVCGTAYLHNQAFHANDAQNQAAPPPTPTPNPATPYTQEQLNNLVDRNSARYNTGGKYSPAEHPSYESQLYTD
jgi:hypothetical protein